MESTYADLMRNMSFKIMFFVPAFITSPKFQESLMSLSSDFKGLWDIRDFGDVVNDQHCCLKSRNFK
jgi:hypothetical protein